MKILLAILMFPVAMDAATLVGDVWTVGAGVPDNSIIGLTSTRPIVTTITSITEVMVNLNLSGGWAGDMYCYVVHGGGFSVLLNRPGRDGSNTDGSGSTALYITLSDNGATDIHTAVADSGTTSGIYQPDARNVDPGSSTGSDPRSAWLSSFDGLDPNGDWTLFVADVASGGTMTLESWSIVITGVPEPSVALLEIAGAGWLLLRRRNIA